MGRCGSIPILKINGLEAVSTLPSKNVFLPALFDGSLSDAELQLFALPTRLAGLGVLHPKSMPTEIFKTSKQGTIVVANALIGKDTFCHVNHLDEARQMHRKVQEDLHQSSLESILAMFTHERQRPIRRAIKGKTSAWLNVVPLESCHLHLAPSQFRDGLATRYQ